MKCAVLCALAASALAACGAADNDPGPGGVTKGEAQALDDAAAMLEDTTRGPADANAARAARARIDAQAAKGQDTDDR